MTAIEIWAAWKTAMYEILPIPVIKKVSSTIIQRADVIVTVSPLSSPKKYVLVILCHEVTNQTNTLCCITLWFFMNSCGTNFIVDSSIHMKVSFIWKPGIKKLLSLVTIWWFLLHYGTYLFKVYGPCFIACAEGNGLWRPILKWR